MTDFAPQTRAGHQAVPYLTPVAADPNVEIFNLGLRQ